MEMNENLRQALAILANDDVENGPEVLELSREEWDKYYGYNRAQQDLLEAMVRVHPGGHTAESMVVQLKYFVEEWLLPSRKGCGEDKIAPLQKALALLREGMHTPVARLSAEPAPNRQGPTTTSSPVAAPTPALIDADWPGAMILRTPDSLDGTSIGTIVDRLNFVDQRNQFMAGQRLDEERFGVKAYIDRNLLVKKFVTTSFIRRARVTLTPWGNVGMQYHLQFEVDAQHPEEAGALLAMVWGTVGAHIMFQQNGGPPRPAWELACELQRSTPRVFRFIPID
jgi:hypothetical protein